MEHQQVSLFEPLACSEEALGAKLGCFSSHACEGCDLEKGNLALCELIT